MKKILYVLIGLLALAGIAYWYINYKPHRDLQHEDIAYRLTAQQLMEAFVQDQSQADSLYVDQIIALKGVLKESEDRALILEPGIYGSLDSIETMPALKTGDSVQLRGRVLSYDELFEEVKLDFVRFID